MLEIPASWVFLGADAQLLWTSLVGVRMSLRGHAATDLNICCTVFPDVFFRFQCEVPMYFDPF